MSNEPSPSLVYFQQLARSYSPLLGLGTVASPYTLNPDGDGPSQAIEVMDGFKHSCPSEYQTEKLIRDLLNVCHFTAICLIGCPHTIIQYRLTRATERRDEIRQLKSQVKELTQEAQLLTRVRNSFINASKDRV